MKCLVLSGIEVIEPLANVELTTPREWEDLLKILPDLGECIHDVTTYDLYIVEDDGSYTSVWKYSDKKADDMQDIIEALNDVSLTDASDPGYKDNLLAFITAVQIGKDEEYLDDGNWRKWKDALELHEQSFEDFLFDRFCARYDIPDEAKNLLDKTAIADNLYDEFSALGYKEIWVDKKPCTARYKWAV